MRIKNKYLRFLWYILPPLLWMAFIFSLSSQQKISVTHTYAPDFAIFKTLHMIEYSILFFFIFRACHGLWKTEQAHQYMISIILSIIYAMTDEIHQLFIASRQGTIRDICIDTIGIMIMYIMIKRYHGVVKRIL